VQAPAQLIDPMSGQPLLRCGGGSCRGITLAAGVQHACPVIRQVSLGGDQLVGGPLPR
jgi:hypothetical protein